MATPPAERMRQMRRRRAAERAAAREVDARSLHDAGELLVPSVAETVAALDLAPEFAGVAELAHQFARAIDAALDAGPRAYASALRWLGPELQKTLDALGATPAARAKMTPPPGKPGPRRPSRVAELRAAHAKATKGRSG